MLKVAIVGCGKIADSHASQIQRIKGCEIVGVCDREPLMARQLYERFPVKRFFGQLMDLLSNARPDVVHISTPRASDFGLIACTCRVHGTSAGHRFARRFLEAASAICLSIQSWFRSRTAR